MAVPEGSIRPARPSDAGGVAALLGELGYPTEEGDARARLERFLAREGTGVLVYERDGLAVGVAAYTVVPMLERPAPQCRLTTLVVSSAHRRRGIARALVGAVEERARELGCFRVEVATRPERPEATLFYLGIGFEERPTRLVKALTTRPRTTRPRATPPLTTPPE